MATTLMLGSPGPNATLAAMANCRDRFAPVQEKTVDELREIYDRWVLERQCLMSRWRATSSASERVT